MPYIPIAKAKGFTAGFGNAQGDDKTVEYMKYSFLNDCDSANSEVALCFMPAQDKRSYAYLILKGYKYEECSLKYEIAQDKNTPPKITLFTEGC